MAVAEAVDKISDHDVRSNAMGIFQANVGIWQILARQGEIPGVQAERFLACSTIEPFATVKTPVQLFDAGRTSLDQK